MCQRLHVLFVQAGYTMIVIFQDDKSDTIYRHVIQPNHNTTAHMTLQFVWGVR